MRWLIEFIANTITLFIDALVLLGLRKTKANWWKERIHQRLAAWRLKSRKPPESAYRMCPSCRALVPIGRRACPDCGLRLASQNRLLKRLLGPLAPAFGSVSATLLGLIILIFAAIALSARDFSLLGNSPAFSGMLARLGSKFWPLIEAGEWWRLVNPIFLHLNLLHLFFNSYALLNLGPILEDIIGSRRFLTIFIATGVFSFLVSSLLSPYSAGVGASGSLFGMIGFGIAFGYRRGGTLFRAFASDLTRWALFGLVFSLSPGIDLAAHVGGFVAGVLFGLIVERYPGQTGRWEPLWTVTAVIAGLLPVVGFLMAFTRL